MISLTKQDIDSLTIDLIESLMKHSNGKLKGNKARKIASAAITA